MTGDARRMEASQRGELERLRRERDLFRRLLELGSQGDCAPFLDEALGLIVELTGAQHGYIEVQADEADAAPFRLARNLAGRDLEKIRLAISQGIVAHALATGETIETTSAHSDVRFSARESVQTNLIEAVLCAPIGGLRASGAVYLQGHEGGGPFAKDDRELLELFAQHLAPRVDDLLGRESGGAAEDPTAPYRAQLRMEGVVGRSPALAAALRQAVLAAPHDVTVLISGESGTGKSQLARIICNNGPRAGAPFVDLNCAAMPDDLLENELFGHMPGAFTGAEGRREGKVAAAEGGTLLLDEVGELPPRAQAKLLQLLQSGEYYPLGGNEPLTADVRIIAASNRDLEQQVREGSFREDLFYRLQVLQIRMPSLAEMRSDLPELARHCVDRACERHGLPHVALSLGALRAIKGSDWPGNVRQLANALTAAAIAAAGEGAAQIEREHLATGLTGRSQPEEEGPRETLAEVGRRAQRQLLVDVLEETDWNVNEAARRLEVSRSHVYNLINAFDLRRS